MPVSLSDAVYGFGLGTCLRARTSSGSRRRQKDDLGGSYSSPFFRNMDYSSVDPRGGVNRKASASFHPPRYGAVRDYSDTVISHAF